MCFGFFVYLTPLLRVHYILLLSCFILLFFLSPFIILFVFVLFYTFSYVTLFTINTSVITLQKKKNPIPGTRALLITSRLSIACSQALLRLAFFHRLPHLWLSTVLLKVHHFISLHFSLFALHFAFTSLLSQSPCQASGHIDIVTSLASHFAFGHVITHTHTLSLSLSLSLSLIFASAFALLHRVTSRLHVTHLGLTPRISASRHASRPLVTLLGRTSHISALRHTSPLCITHLGFSFSLGFLFYFCFSTSALAFPHSVTSRLYVTHLGFTSRVSASHHTPQLHITHLASHFRPSASL